MKTLNIIESIYSGKPYQDTLDVRLDLPATNGYKLSRYQQSLDRISDLRIEPYDFDFETYSSLLSRVELLIEEPVEADIRFYSPESEFEKIVASYQAQTAVLREPTMVDNLLYETDCGTYLTPLGVLAFLFRRSYGNEKFKQHINSTVLKQYFKVSLKNSPVFYFYKGCREDMHFIKRLGELYPNNRWNRIKDILIQSPNIFSWRD